MDHSEDVDRLFSWLKAPQVHYREFAPQRELADAVATWPVVHRAAVETGVAAADEAAPAGDAVAKERLARDRMVLPTRPAQQVATAAAETPGEPSEAAATPPPGWMETAHYEPDETPIAVEPASGAAPHEASEPVIAGFEQPGAPPPRSAPSSGAQYKTHAAEPARHYPSAGREALFSGEYRGGERSRPAARVADRQDRSLDAVFSRLGGGRDRLPDPRARARTSPGLGHVFNRLR